MVGKPFLRLLPCRQIQPLGAPLRAARVRANRSARIGCARQYQSIASRGVGGMNGRLSARTSTTGGKIVGRLLESRSTARLFLSAFSSCHFDISGPTDEAIMPSKPLKPLSLSETRFGHLSLVGLYTVRKRHNKPSGGETEIYGQIAPQAGHADHQKTNSYAKTAPRRRPTHPRILTEAEVERLMKAATGNRHGYRDVTMILVAYRHGLRVSELVDLQNGHLARPSGQAWHSQHAPDHWGRAASSAAAPARAGPQVALRVHLGAGGAIHDRRFRPDD